jgi:hypothetical protein
MQYIIENLAHLNYLGLYCSLIVRQPSIMDPRGDVAATWPVTSNGIQHQKIIYARLLL